MRQHSCLGKIGASTTDGSPTLWLRAGKTRMTMRGRSQKRRSLNRWPGRLRAWCHAQQVGWLSQLRSALANMPPWLHMCVCGTKFNCLSYSFSVCWKSPCLLMRCVLVALASAVWTLFIYTPYQRGPLVAPRGPPVAPRGPPVAPRGVRCCSSLCSCLMSFRWLWSFTATISVAENIPKLELFPCLQRLAHHQDGELTRTLGSGLTQLLFWARVPLTLSCKILCKSRIQSQTTNLFVLVTVGRAQSKLTSQ